MYISSLNKVQVGKETAYADGSDATIQLPGITDLSVKPIVEGEQIVDMRGTTMPAYNSVVKRRYSEGDIEGILNYNLAYLWFDNVFGEATPASGVYSYEASLDWEDEEESSLALYYGQEDLIFTVPGVIIKDFEISGESNGFVTYKGDFFGNPVEDGASFQSLTTSDVDWVMGSHVKLYLDSGIDATPGTTEMEDIGFKFEAKISSNKLPVWHLGSQVNDEFKHGKWGGEVKLVLQADATTLSHYGSIIDATTSPAAFAVRIGMTDGANTLNIDFVGEAIEPADIIEDLDGVVTINIDLKPVYGTTFENCWKVNLTVA